MRNAPATRLIRSAADDQDLDAAAAIVAEAFSSLQATAWLVPEPDRRMIILTDVFRILVRHARDHGQVDLLVQMPKVGGARGRHSIGAAVWFHRDHEIPPPADYSHRLREAAGEYTSRFEILDRLFNEHHPDQSHHHLALLAVVPNCQGKGAGSALLQHHHAGLVLQEMPAYLEASNLQSRDLYLDHGYRAHGQPFSLPNGATFHPMWRTPSGIEDSR